MTSKDDAILEISYGLNVDVDTVRSVVDGYWKSVKDILEVEDYDSCDCHTLKKTVFVKEIGKFLFNDYNADKWERIKKSKK